MTKPACFHPEGAQATAVWTNSRRYSSSSNFTADTHTYTHTYIHTYIRTYIRTYTSIIMLMTARVAAMPAGTTSRTSLTGYRNRNRNRNRVVVRAAEPSAEPVAKPDVCKTCGLPTSEMPWGCSGDGRVQGGIGAVPGFRWWVMTSTDVRSRAISHSRYATLVRQVAHQGVSSVSQGGREGHRVHAQGAGRRRGDVREEGIGIGIGIGIGGSGLTMVVIGVSRMNRCGSCRCGDGTGGTGL